MKGKRKLLRHHARKKKIHCILLPNIRMEPEPNFYHLTGFDGYGCLLLLKDKEILFVPRMEFLRAKRTVKGVSIKKFGKSLGESIKKYTKGGAIGLDYNSVTLHFMKTLRKELKGRRFVDVSSVLESVRMVKTPEEIRILKKACMISDMILKKCLSKMKSFRTELDVRNFLKEETIKYGCDLSFSPVVASGIAAAEPHHRPQNKRLGKGFCIIDFGVKYMGYCSDTTRTVYIGKPGKKEVEIYNVVVKVQRELVNELKAGQRCSEIYGNSTKKLGPYAEYFNHGLGHGVGMEIHELPSLRPKSKDRIQQNMVFTVEPGIYISGRMGIRIEDTVFMGKKPVLLTKIPKDLLIVKKTK